MTRCIKNLTVVTSIIKERFRPKLSKSSDYITTKLTGVIAEIGNHHLGSVEMAKTMIKEAKASGADMVKMQAIEASVVAKTGSMPYSFYKECELSTEEYAECVRYGKTLGIQVFFSIFGTKHKLLWKMFPDCYRKISGGQFLKMTPEDFDAKHGVKTIVSIPEKAEFDKIKSFQIWSMQKMMVTPYLPKAVDWDYLDHLKSIFRRVGYSDHTPGIEACKTAIRDYGCRLVEKHFHLGTDIVWEGVRYRDCLHAATPKEFKELTDFFHTYRKRS